MKRKRGERGEERREKKKKRQKEERDGDSCGSCHQFCYSILLFHSVTTLGGKAYVNLLLAESKEE
jgi:hypothetical protein